MGIKLRFTINFKEGDSSYIVINCVNVSSYPLLYNRTKFTFPPHFLSQPCDLGQWKMTGSDNVLILSRSFKKQCVSAKIFAFPSTMGKGTSLAWFPEREGP